MPTKPYWVDMSVTGGRFPFLCWFGDAEGRRYRCRLPCPLGGRGLDRSALGDRRAILLGAARMVQGSAASRRGRLALTRTMLIKPSGRAKCARIGGGGACDCRGRRPRDALDLVRSVC